MDLQTLFNAAVTVVVAAVGGILRWFWGIVHETRKELQDHRVEIARDYATNSSIKRIEDKIDRILERMSGE